MWLSITRSYFKNNGFEVSELRLLNKDTCQQFKAHQNSGNESYVINFYSTGRIVINSKCLDELLENRVPSLENLYEITFKIKQGVETSKHKEATTRTNNNKTTHTSNKSVNNENSTNPETEPVSVTQTKTTLEEETVKNITQGK